MKRNNQSIRLHACFVVLLIILGIPAILPGVLSTTHKEGLASAQEKGGRTKPTPAPTPSTQPQPARSPTSHIPSANPAKPGPAPNAVVRQIVGNWMWPPNPRVGFVFSPNGTGTYLPSNTRCSDFRYQIQGDLLVLTRPHYEDCKENERETARLNVSGNDMQLTFLTRRDKEKQVYWLIRTTGSNELAFRFHSELSGSRPPYKIGSIVESGAHVEFMSPLVVVNETVCCRKVVRMLTDPRPAEYETFIQAWGFRSPVSGTVIRTFVTIDQEIKADELLLIIRKDQ